MATTPVQESIRQVEDNSWLVGEKLLLTRTTPSESIWEYTVVPVSHPLPGSRPLRDDDEHVTLVYQAGDSSAVFSIGKGAFCKVKLLDTPQITREHITLSWLHARKWSFPLPKILYHAEFGDRYYLFISKITGQTLDSIWPELEDAQRQYFVERIVSICEELAVPAPGDAISGVDGSFVPEEYLCARSKDCSPKNLRKNSLALGMDRSNLVFYHCDLGPTNIQHNMAQIISQ